jgi:hypothetical protein
MFTFRRQGLRINVATTSRSSHVSAGVTDYALRAVFPAIGSPCIN